MSHFVLIALLTMLAASACAIPVEGMPTTPNLPTSAPPPTRTRTPPTVTEAVPPVLPSPTITSTAPARTKLCSPLAALSLDEIPPYVTQPFVPPSLGRDAAHPDWVRKDDGHHGLDVGYYKRDDNLFTGTPVLAALEGRIAAIVHDRPPYGNMLVVETAHERLSPAFLAGHAPRSGDSLYTLYAHLQNLHNLTIGQTVQCGQPLAETGLTGFTGGPHLHFETRWGPPGRTFTSMAYYRADATAEEMSNYETWRMSAVFELFDPMELFEGWESKP